MRVILRKNPEIGLDDAKKMAMKKLPGKIKEKEKGNQKAKEMEKKAMWTRWRRR